MSNRIFYLVLIILTFSFNLFGQVDQIEEATDTLSKNLSKEAVWQIGVSEMPPYCMQDEQGNWSGIAVQLWRQVAEAEQIRYEWSTFPSSENTMEALVNNEIDLALYVPIRAEKEDKVDFLPIYHSTTLGIAMPKRNDFISIGKGLFTMKFLYVVLSLSALLLVIAIIFWLIERNENEDDFGGDRTWYEGIGASFWWAGVTLTTIGYGDKAPQSFGGRTVAMLWMLISMFVTATLTASLVSVFGSENTVSFPGDLQDKKIAVVKESPASDYLKKENLNPQEMDDTAAGLEALNNQEIDYFIHNAGSLQYYKKTHKNFSPSIQTTNKAPQAFAFALASDQVVRDDLQQRIYEKLLSENWQNLLKEHGLVGSSE